MTTEERKLANEGKDYWQHYVNLNGYAFRPNSEGLRLLSRDLDLNTAYLCKCINLYLNA